MGKSGKGLKGALQSQQARLKEKAKIAQAAQAAEQKARIGRGQKLPTTATKGTVPPVDTKGKGKAITYPRRPPTIPFKLSDRILLVGEGNFSFTRAIVQNPPEALRNLPPTSVTATAYDTEKECYEKYPDAEATVAFLREKGVEVLFDIDATRLEKYASLKKRKFDRISFNFPHAGAQYQYSVCYIAYFLASLGKGITDQDRNILSNQVLLLGFLQSAARMLKSGPIPSVHKPKRKKRNDDDEDDEELPMQDGFVTGLDDTEELQFLSQPADEESRGTVLVTLRNVIPYTQW